MNSLVILKLIRDTVKDMDSVRVPDRLQFTRAPMVR